MNKKFLSAILFGALMVSSTGTFVSCKDYDDDIERIDKELTDVKSALTTLQEKVNNGSYVTNVTATADGKGMVFTFSNGDPITVNLDIEEGTAGTVVTQDEETGELLINNEKTGIFPAEDPAKESVKVEDGFWVFLNEEGEYETSNIPVNGTYVVDGGAFWTMSVPNEEGVYQTIKLAKTAPITNLKACQISADGVIGDAEVAISYGKKLASEVKFNEKTYAKDAILLSSESALSAIVNPLDADATIYEFALTDSKGNKPFVISEVKANETENALRATTVNKGAFDMTVAYASTDYCGKAEGPAYALTTTTANGEVASAYEVNVTEREVTSITDVTLNSLSGDINKEIDLMDCFENDPSAAEVNEEGVKDLKPYIVDYYFEVADKTLASTLGVTLNGNKISATKEGTLPVKVNYLLVDGTIAEGETAKKIEVEFNYVAPETTLSDVEWTVNTTTQEVYLPLGDLQASLAADLDTKLPSVAELGWSWTDGTALDSKTVTVNDVKYGKDGVAFAGNESDWISTIDTENLYVKNTDGTYAAATATTTIQTPLYIKFAFSYATAFPGEYQVKLGLKKNGNDSDNNDFEVPVKVTIKSPAESAVSPFSRLDAYFVGDDAVAYGEAEDGVVSYNLFSLYKNMGEDEINVTFAETLHEIDGHNCVAWIQTDGEEGDIKVNAYDNTADADNRDNAYSTREMQAIYTVFGNEHIAKVVDTFNLTIKSVIAEGTLEATDAANASGHGVDPIVVSFKNITAKDVYGKAYNLAATYKQAADKTWSVEDKQADDRLESVEIVPADDNAEQYLAIGAITNVEDGFSGFSVTKKSETTALAQDVACKVAVKVTDKWGKITTTEVTITLTK